MAFRHRMQQLLVRNLLSTAEKPWMSTMQGLSSAGSARSVHSTTIPDLPSRRGIFAELPLVSSMLPNRKHMVAQFGPHGLTLVPRSLLQPTSAPTTFRPDVVLAATSGPVAATVPAVQEPTDPQQRAPMMVRHTDRQ